MHNPVSPNSIQQAKWAFSVRRVPRSAVTGICPDVNRTMPGDLVLGRVLKVGFQKRLQLSQGRPADLYADDLVVVACGARYAPDQYEGVAELNAEGCDLLAAGGILGRYRSSHAKVGAPTRVQPLGLLTGACGEVLNVSQFALPELALSTRMTVIGVVGASMNSGKTTATAHLAHGLQRAGFEAAAIKCTGTGSFGDHNTFVDTGAHFVADFTDAGMASTYQQPVARIETGLRTLLAHAAASGCEVAVVEFADGVLQQETAALLRSPSVQGLFAGWMYACPDALAAVGGVHALRTMGLAPLALSGLLCVSPLAMSEATAATGIDVWDRSRLADPAGASGLLARVMARTRVAAGQDTPPPLFKPQVAA